MEASPFYESPALRKVAGPTLRPGGFTLTERAVEFCGLDRGARVLDVGCGLGATVNWLETGYGFRAMGVDPSLDLLGDCRSLSAWASLVAGRADRLPFREKGLDAVFCECVVSLLVYPGRALAEFGRVLRPGGWLAITDLYARRPEGAAALKALALPSCLKGAGTRQKIIALVEDAGFEVVLWEDHSPLLKHLAAGLVFECGSMREFRSLFAPECCGSDWERAIGSARPGYYLMAAEKRD